MPPPPPPPHPPFLSSLHQAAVPPPPHPHPLTPPPRISQAPKPVLEPHPGVVRLLAEASSPSELNALDVAGKAPLHLAAACGSLDALRAVLDAGADVECLDGGTGETPLHAAAGALQAGAVRLLLERGADARAEDLGRATPLLRCGAALLERPLPRKDGGGGLNAEPGEVTEEGWRLAAAMRASALDAVDALLAAGADVNAARGADGATLLVLAAASEAGRDPGFLGALLDRGADVNAAAAPKAGAGAGEDEARDRGRGAGRGRRDGGVRGTALAVVAGLSTKEGVALPLELVQFLLSRGADPNAGPRSARPIAAAADQVRTDAAVLQALLEAGASLDAEVPSFLWKGPPALSLLATESAAARECLLRGEAARLSAPGAPRPAIERALGANPLLEEGRRRDAAMLPTTGLPFGLLAAAFVSAIEGRNDLTALALDLLLCCEGPLRERDFLLFASPMARTIPSKEETERLLRGVKGACRLGFRLTALRLARAAPAPALDEPDAEGRTPLHHAVAFGPEMLDVCGALFDRGAELTARALDATRDAAFRRALKERAALRQVFISYGHKPPEVAAFAARLRDRLEADGVMCWMDEMKATGIQAGTEWREEIGRGLRAAKAVVFVASPHSCGSDWCMLELSRARDLGKALAPVWRLRSELDPRAATLLAGLHIADFTTDELFESGYPDFLAGLRAALSAAGAVESEGGPEEAARALLARPHARCDPAAGPFCLLWCTPEDAPRMHPVLDAAAASGVRCFVDCSDGPPGAEASAALAACSAFVPLLSPSSASSPALALRLQAAAARSVPVRPLVLSGVQVPFALEYSLAQTRGFPLLAAGPAEDPEDLPAVSGNPKLEALRAAIAEADADLARLEARARELQRAAAGGGPGGAAGAGSAPTPTPAHAPVGDAPAAGLPGAGAGSRQSPQPPARAPPSNSRACALM
eukprot:tig00001098_g7053.t1